MQSVRFVDMLYGIALTLCLVATARPTGYDAARSRVSKKSLAEIGRLARAVNLAYCPLDHRDSNLRLQPSTELKDVETEILVSSEDARHEQQALDMTWYISHTPSTHTLTLAFSSLAYVEELVEYLDYTDGPDALIDLPDYLLPSAASTIDIPQIHGAYLSPLKTHGTPALRALLSILGKTHSEITSKDATGVRRIDITGHGLGAAMALLISPPVAESTTHALVHTTLFGLPRIGDRAFADMIDHMDASSRVRIHRVTSYKDAVPHLPAEPTLIHPAKGQVWISSDPRVAYHCKAALGSNCGDDVKWAETSVFDHQGPYGGVWLGAQTCSQA